MRGIANMVRLTGLVFVLAAAACSTTPGGSPQSSAAPPAISLPPPGPMEVKVDSRWNYSGYENRPAAKWLLESARDSVALGPDALDRLVQRWPDLTLDLLRDGVSGDADVPLCLSIADSYDRLFGTGDAGAGWYSALSVSASQSDAYSTFRSAREQLLASFQSGQFANAVNIDPVAALPVGAPAALQTEALRLAGLVALLNDQPERAADYFARAVAQAQAGSRHVQFEIGLLLSESQRRLDQPQAAASAWLAAVSSADDVRDPDLWERAILTKPANVQWPAQAAIAGAGEPDFSNGQPPDTADVLIGVGKMRLVRGATQAALLAFSRAETETSVPQKKELARLYRVQSMITLQLAASALPMLDGLMKSTDSRIACRAQALEGDIYSRIMGDRARGIPMMRAALENPGAGDWPGKNRLTANLGLYYLLEGDSKQGLRLLHLCDAQFEAGSQWEDLARSLQNEAAYLRAADKNDEADAVQKRADDISRRAGLPVGPLTDAAVTDSTPDGSTTAH